MAALTVVFVLSVLSFRLPTVVGADDHQLHTDSRAPYIHIVNLYSTAGEVISLEDEPLSPYSPTRTCGKCHPVGKVGHGWHFNAPLAVDSPGRPGEPWILADHFTGTQIPLSYRRWPGTFHPEELGITPWDFVKRYGHHLPGGGPGSAEYLGNKGEGDEAVSPRWNASGYFEIDCMLCHSADKHYDPNIRVRQLGEENYRWAATAALQLAVVHGTARNLPDDFDPEFPLLLGFDDKAPPKIEYDEKRFDYNERVFFNIVREPPNERCYFCHTIWNDVATTRDQRWRHDTDIHLARGMKCVDCHRNDIGHMITRGDDDPDAAGADLAAATLSCRGCHLGSHDKSKGSLARGGRLTAPYPKHKGFPPLHFEELACTACHSGPWPDAQVNRVQTALAHKLGMATKLRHQGSPPSIVAPVFQRRNDGRIAPHRALYPAYWGFLEDHEIKPITPDNVQQVTAAILGPFKKSSGPRWVDLNQEQVSQVLEVLGKDKTAGGIPVYVNGGKVYQQAEDGSLTSAPHAVARPYTWTIAHDVRPATQALGANGCTDCHAAGAPLFYGKVDSSMPSPDAESAPQPMLAFLGLSEQAALLQVWERSFVFRTPGKWVGFGALAILGGVLFLCFLQWLGGLTKWLRGS